MKALIRRLLRPLSTRKLYDPTPVGGWVAWYEIAGRCIAFEDVDGGILYDW